MYDYKTINELLKEKKPVDKNIKIKENEAHKFKLKITPEKVTLDNNNKEKSNKESKNNNYEKKEDEIKIDTPNPDKNDANNENYNEVINKMLSQKETKLLTNSQYVSFDNFIGDNSCYINVIMHFLYIFPCVNDFLIKEKEQEPKKETIIQTQKEIITKKPEDDKDKTNPVDKKKKKENEYNNFLFHLGKVLNSYQDILTANDLKNNITNLNTIELRKSLSICSDNKFKLNSISDPVEFLIYILDLINKENSEEIHLYFHLKLIEEVRCSNFCPFKSNRKYDKDNFIYQIYVEEIFNYIKNQKISFDDFKENLFMLSYYSIQNEMDSCEKCNSLKNKILICNNEDGSPKFLLVNCVWNNAKPDLKDVIKFLYFISLIEQLDNLFICPSKTEKTFYYLHGIIFYSFTLCHYINVIFNLQKNVFTLYNDTGIIEFENMNEVYYYITKEQLRKNNRAYFYPVLLVYGKENIYDEKILYKIKRINKINYELLLEACDKLIKVNNKPKEKPLTEEEKQKNYRELIIAQIKYDRENMENNMNKESDDIYKLMRYKENGGLKKINIINEQKKNNKANNFLQNNKDNKKINKAASVDKRYSENARGLYNYDNKEFNPYNFQMKNFELPKRTSNHYNYGYGYGYRGKY